MLEEGGLTTRAGPAWRRVACSQSLLLDGAAVRVAKGPRGGSGAWLAGRHPGCALGSLMVGKPGAASGGARPTHVGRRNGARGHTRRIDAARRSQGVL